MALVPVLCEELNIEDAKLACTKGDVPSAFEADSAKDTSCSRLGQRIFTDIVARFMVDLSLSGHWDHVRGFVVSPSWEEVNSNVISIGLGALAPFPA